MGKLIVFLLPHKKKYIDSKNRRDNIKVLQKPINYFLAQTQNPQNIDLYLSQIVNMITSRSINQLVDRLNKFSTTN